MGRMSIATIDSPEFINITPCNPLISQCEIKVLYVGQNRNRSYISKEVAAEMANTLPGCPIVGYYRQDKEDFDDHGDRVIIDSDGVKFECLTTPYGFVDPAAKVWFQKFEDTDDFGNTIEREYLMTTGYLWTGQFPECKTVVESGKPHSMELDESTLDGHWSNDVKTGIDFFIINDAIFSKLCILGDDVEPCFEGSSVTAPQVSKTFSKVDDKFKQTLFTMMQELKEALEGGQKMPGDGKFSEENLDNAVQIDFQENQENVEDAEKFAKSEDNEDFAKKDEKEEEEKASEDKPEDKEDDEDKYAAKEENKDDDDDKEDKQDDDDEDEKKKYSLLESNYQALEIQHQELQAKYENLQTQYQALEDFKKEVENEKKDALIATFYMLSDEDKKEVIENKAKYSLEEIESKLAVICVRKKVSFDLESEEQEQETQAVATYNLDAVEASTPAWVKALKNTQKSRNI